MTMPKISKEDRSNFDATCYCLAEYIKQILTRKPVGNDEKRVGNILSKRSWDSKKNRWITRIACKQEVPNQMSMAA